MRLRLNDCNGSAFSALIALTLFLGVLISVGLSAAPQLHNLLHKSDASHHQCAATQMSNGTWHQATCEPTLTAPQPASVSPSFVRPGICVIARAEISILEHAPPAIS